MQRFLNTKLRHGALLALAVFVSARTAALWHELTVTHVTCAEHGELIHVGEPETDSTAPDFAGVQSANVATAHDDHEHCSTYLVARAKSRPNTAKLSLAPVAPGKLPQPTAPPAPSAKNLQRLAPKTSPPDTAKA